jgi:hypothetical protein
VLRQHIQNLGIKEYKIIIIDNNGVKTTFLDSFGLEVFYTRNNFLQKVDKGYKELKDILDCITRYNILDSDFIVKITGRYILKENSEFMNTIKNLHIKNYQCVIKYGSYIKPVNHKMNDCISGLIGMSCFYIKQIKYPKIKECIEWKWAEITNLIEDKNIYICSKLGINICPGSNKYFSV